MRERIGLANEINPYVGKYYSIEYVRKNVLQQSDEDIIDIDNQIADEIKKGIIASPEVEGMDDTDINIEGDE